MCPPYRLYTLLLIGLSLPAVAEPVHDFCAQLVPNLKVTRGFYEDNPTYIDPNHEAPAWQTDSPESQGLSSKKLDEAAAQLAALPQPLSLLVLRKGKLVYERYFHGSDKSHANNIHSASKSLISSLIGIAIREGFLEGVDQKISSVLSPKFKFKGKRETLTVENLLRMSAGFSWTEDETEYDIEVTPNWVQAILDLPLQTKIGATFNYDTGLTHLLSALITESSKRDTCSFAEKYLFGPLNITVKHWGKDPQGYYSGGYNLYLTPRDLMKLGMLFLQDGKWNGKEIVPADWVHRSTQNGIPTDSSDYRYGYLWWLPTVKKHNVAKMWGYGGQFVYIVPDLDLVVVTTADTKKEYAEVDGESLLSLILPASDTTRAPKNLNGLRRKH